MLRGSSRQENTELLTEADIQKARSALDREMVLTNVPTPQRPRDTMRPPPPRRAAVAVVVAAAAARAVVTAKGGGGTNLCYAATTN